MADSTIIPSEIEHLDWDPDAKEEEEKEKVCEFMLLHPHTPGEWVKCGLLAVYKITVKKSCGHEGTSYLCEKCWTDALSTPDRTWTCLVRDDDGKRCLDRFLVRESITSMERIK